MERKRKPSYLYFIMTLLSILGVMEVIFLMTYMKPSDGAVWEETEEGLIVSSILREVESPLQVGDVLRQMDDTEIKDLQTYEDSLFQYPIGSKHLYTLIREGSHFEPWVTVSGLREKPDAYLFFAMTGFVFLLFAFLIVGQSIPHREKNRLVLLSLCVYSSFIFYRTDLLTPLDWVSFFLNLLGGSFLGSCFFDSIMGRVAFRKIGFVPVNALHWFISSLIFFLDVAFLLWAHRIETFHDLSFSDFQKVQQFWTIGLCMFGLVLALFKKEVKAQWESMIWAWIFSFVPFFVYLLKLDFPFDAILAATFPSVLPIAIFFDWNRSYRMFLEGGRRQIAIYATILLVLFLGFFIFLGSFYQLLAGKMSSETQLFLSSFGMVLAAVSFAPLRKISENFWNKIVYGERLGALKNLMDVALINRADTNLNEFFKVILLKIQSGFGIQELHAYIFNRNRKAFFDIAGKWVPLKRQGLTFQASGEEVWTADQVGLGDTAPFRPHDLILPMAIHETVVAFLHLSNGEEPIQLSLEESQLLKNLLNHCEVLLENIELYRDANENAHRIEKLREFNESIIESSQVGMVAVDEMGLVVSCNQAFIDISGFKGEDPNGLRFHYLLEEYKIERIYQGKNGEVIEGRFRNPSGVIRLLEIQKTPLKSRNNEIYGTLYLVEDIREKKAIQEKMMQQEKLASIGLLAAGVAHEINTPLTGIQSYSQMLVNEDLQIDHKELVENILQQSHRAGRIVRELLDFTRKDNTAFELIELKQVLNQAYILMSHTFKKSQVTFFLDAPEHEILIRGNANQLQQVFINLMVNAIDAMHPGGKLQVCVIIQENHILVDFVDNGTGIEEKVINRIFDPFFTTKEAGKGTGLGLSMVYNILREHNAEISVESVLTVGTRMKLKFCK